MRTLLVVTLACSLAYAKPPNPADFPLTIDVLSSDTKLEHRQMPTFTPTKTDTDCQIYGNNASCQSTTQAENNLIDIHVTYVKFRLDDVLYTVSCRYCSNIFVPGSYKAKWEGGRRELKVLWSDGKKNHTVDCGVVAMIAAKAE